MGLLHLLVLVVGGSLIDIFIRSTFRVGYCDVGLGLGGYACCGVSVGVCVCVPGLLDFMQVGHIDVLQWVDSQ